MVNSNVRYLSAVQTNSGSFTVIQRLLRYAYASSQTQFSVLNKMDAQEGYALRHAYLSRAGLKRRLKQVALQHYDLHD